MMPAPKYPKGALSRGGTWCPVCGAEKDRRAKHCQRHAVGNHPPVDPALEARNEQIRVLRAKGYTLDRLGRQFGLSHERIRQICEKEE